MITSDSLTAEIPDAEDRHSFVETNKEFVIVKSILDEKINVLILLKKFWGEKKYHSIVPKC